MGEGGGGHPKFGVRRGDDDVEPVEQVVVLVERAVGQDVALDAGEQPEGCQAGVQLRDRVQLAAQPVGRQAVGDPQPRRVVGEHRPPVPGVPGREGHRLDRAAAVRPVGVQVAVAAQRSAQRGAALGERAAAVPFQVGQIARGAAGGGLGEDLARGGADALEVGEPAGRRPPFPLCGGSADSTAAALRNARMR